MPITSLRSTARLLWASCASWGIALCFCFATMSAAQAQGFVHAASYSLEAPADLYLSEDPRGCDNHAQSLRQSGARVLIIRLYPDAYCSLMQAAQCQYIYVRDPARAFASGEHGIRRSHFTASWDDTCVGPRQSLPDIAQGSLAISEASDLGLQGSYDLMLTDHSMLRGVFDSVSCPMPRRARMMCLKKT